MSNEMLVRYCAPTMASLKTGSMFCCRWADRNEMIGELRELNRRLRGKGLRILPLRWKDNRALVYLYRPGMLDRDLKAGLSQKLLLECGYPQGDTGSRIAELISRLESNQDFPHEVGLFLGYPPEDVDGFMHRKDDWRMNGLWKVYGDVEEARRRFEQCRRCTREYLCRIGQGCPLESLAVPGEQGLHPDSAC